MMIINNVVEKENTKETRIMLLLSTYIYNILGILYVLEANVRAMKKMARFLFRRKYLKDFHQKRSLYLVQV